MTITSMPIRQQAYISRFERTTNINSHNMLAKRCKLRLFFGTKTRTHSHIFSYMVLGVSVAIEKVEVMVSEQEQSETMSIVPFWGRHGQKRSLRTVIIIGSHALTIFDDILA